jgi:hypothetical protein
MCLLLNSHLTYPLLIMTPGLFSGLQMAQKISNASTQTCPVGGIVLRGKTELAGFGDPMERNTTSRQIMRS